MALSQAERVMQINQLYWLGAFGMPETPVADRTKCELLGLPMPKDEPKRLIAV